MAESFAEQLARVRAVLAAAADAPPPLAAIAEALEVMAPRTAPVGATGDHECEILATEEQRVDVAARIVVAVANCGTTCAHVCTATDTISVYADLDASRLVCAHCASTPGERTITGCAWCGAAATKRTPVTMTWATITAIGHAGECCRVYLWPSRRI